MRFSSLSLWLLLLTALCRPLHAQEQPKSSFRFLNTPSTAQTVAIGGLSITYVDANPGLAFDNPALYGEETAGQLFLSYQHLQTQINAAHALYGLSVGDRGAWAVGLKAINYGRMAGYDAFNQATHSFSATDMALVGLFSYDLTTRLRGGITLKMLYSNIESYHALGVAVDAGLSYYNGESGTAVGLNISNAGTTIKGYDSHRALTPWDVRLGLSQALSYLPLRFHLVAYGLNPEAIRYAAADKRLKTTQKILRHFNFGLEYRLNDRFWLAAGINPRVAQDLAIQGGNFLSGLSLGGGFSTNSFRIALAATRYHPSQLSFMLSFSTNFGNLSNSY